MARKFSELTQDFPVERRQRIEQTPRLTSDYSPRYAPSDYSDARSLVGVEKGYVEK